MILAAIIAGGRATRFGSDKALADLAGRPLIDHVIAAVRGHVAAVAICGRTHADHLALADRPLPDLGPLGGLNAALHHAATQGFENILMLPCDTPWLDPAMLAALTRHPGPAYLAECPVIGVWPARLASALDRFLSNGHDRSMRAWARATGAEPLAWPAPANINRVADLHAQAGARPRPAA